MADVCCRRLRLTPEDIVAAEVRDRDRDIWLAVHYAPAVVRPGLLALFGIDLEMRAIVATTSDAMIGQIRLAWWREACEGLDAGRLPAQPLLQLAADALVPAGIRGSELAEIEDRWIGLIDSDEVPAEHIAGGGRLFALAARLTGGSGGDADRLGRVWAGAAGPLPRVGAALRPLLGLAMLAQRDAARGGEREPRGNLARQWRLLRAVATGR